MGADILNKMQAEYKKHIDRNRYGLSQLDLFAVDPSKITRNIVCDVVDPMSINSGDPVTIQATSGTLATFRGRQLIGECKNPPQLTYDSIIDCGGAARAEVTTLNPLSGTFEASICE